MYINTSILDAGAVDLDKSCPLSVSRDPPKMTRLSQVLTNKGKITERKQVFLDSARMKQVRDLSRDCCILLKIFHYNFN